MRPIVRSKQQKSFQCLACSSKYALKRNLKTQVLSLNAYRYLMEKLQKLHELFGCIIMWQIKRARVHVSWSRPSTLALALVNHFIELYTFLLPLLGFITYT